MLYQPTVQETLRILKAHGLLPMGGSAPSQDYFYAGHPWCGVSPGSLVSFLINSTGASIDRLAGRFIARYTDTLDKAAMRIGGSIVGLPTAQLGVWSVNTDGTPNALLGAAVTFSPVTNSMNEVTFTSKPSLTAGQPYFIVLDATVADGSNSFYGRYWSHATQGSHRPYTQTDGGAWTGQLATFMGFVTYTTGGNGQDGTWFYDGAYSSAVSAWATTTGTSVGWRYIPRFNGNLTGVWMGLQISGTPDADMVLGILNASNVVQWSTTIGRGAIFSVRPNFFPIPNYAVTAGTEIRIAIGRNGGTTGGWQLSTLDYASAPGTTLSDTYAPGGDEFQSLASTTGTNNLAATAGRKPQGGMEFGSVVAPAGGGGLLTHPGMGGGMRG